MISILLVVNKEKNLKKIKNISHDDLYKKCGFKTDENFEKLYEKNIENISYQYWSKKEGKESYKYILNNITYYNKLLIVKTKNNEFQNITEEDYYNIFNNENIKSNNEENENNKENEDNQEDNKEDNKEDENNELNSDSELSEEPYVFSSDEEN